MFFPIASENRLNHQTNIQICNQSEWDYHECTPAIIGNWLTDNNSRYRFSVSRPQISWLQAFSWPPSNDNTAIAGTKPEPIFIRKYNRFPHKAQRICPQMSYSLTSPTSQCSWVSWIIDTRCLSCCSSWKWKRFVRTCLSLWCVGSYTLKAGIHLGGISLYCTKKTYHLTKCFCSERLEGGFRNWRRKSKLTWDGRD